MKNHLFTSSLRTIKSAFPRFLSLLIMSLLGVMVFVGIKATCPAMINSLNTYYQHHNVYDLKIISTMGLTHDDIDALKELPLVNEVQGEYTKDVLINHQDHEYVIKVFSLPGTINQITISQGKLPALGNEIVVEENMLSVTGLTIGDPLYLTDDDFVTQKVYIVGVIRSPLFIEATQLGGNRGNTNLGSGTINFYIYGKASNFNANYYSAIYLTVKGAPDYITASNAYEKLITKSKDQVKVIKPKQEENRYAEIKYDAEQTIKSNEIKMNKEFKQAKNKLDQAKKALSNAKKGLNLYQKELIKNEKEIKNAQALLTESLNKYGLTIPEVKDKITELKSALKEINFLLSMLNSESDEYTLLVSQKQALKSQLNNLKPLIKTDETLKQGMKALKQEQTKYQKALKTYEQNYELYQKNLKKYQAKKQEALNKINEAKEELATLSKPKWYVNDRHDDSTYDNFITDAKSIEALDKVFPTIFFAIAILISLMSMSRMVEEDRGELGILKSLGYNNLELSTKYLLFAFLATITGGLIGIILGLIIIPSLIWRMYELLFTLPKFYLDFSLKTPLTGIFIAMLCICGATIFTLNQALKEKTANLMRPKPPKLGKRVSLEKITWLWSRLNFSQKITLRNLFRYKKRAFATIVGIVGGSALILAGFGIRDSVINIPNLNYTRILTYDAAVYLNEDLGDDELSKAFNNELIKKYIPLKTMTATAKNYKLTLIIPNDETNFKEVIGLYDLNTKARLALTNDKVIITDKLANLLNLKVNDPITILDNNHREYTFIINAITENYVGHHLYLNKSTYEKNFGSYEINTVFLTANDLSNGSKHRLSTDLLAHDKVIRVVFTEEIVRTITNMLNSLNAVVLIIVTLSAILSFVILYNLSTININERKRELASLKVLGFYPKEIDQYITRENTILTIIGIVFGLIAGYFLAIIIINMVEIEYVRFIRIITWQSYLYTALITILFTLIVNFITHYVLKRIKMIESLKSVE